MREQFSEKLLNYVNWKDAIGQPCLTDVPGLVTLCSDQPTKLEGTLYNPVICLILQGRKETYVGDRKFGFGMGESLIVSHDIPVMTRITEASPQKPYLAVALSIDMQILRSLHDQVEETEMASQGRCAMDATRAEVSLVNAMERLFALVDNPLEAKVMVPLVLREIHFRILMAKNGSTLRQLLMRDSYASRIAKAINLIRRDYAAPLSVSDLAAVAGMSTSSFHEHFKAVTSFTPLQYQKDLRLLHARRLLQEGDHNVSAAAFEVGYESPTQFSREYARKFGVSPRTDRAGSHTAALAASVARRI